MNPDNCKKIELFVEYKGESAERLGANLFGGLTFYAAIEHMAKSRDIDVEDYVLEALMQYTAENIHDCLEPCPHCESVGVTLVDVDHPQYDKLCEKCVKRSYCVDCGVETEDGQEQCFSCYCDGMPD